MGASYDLDTFGRRETEILERLGNQREEAISALVRTLVEQTIGEVEELLEGAAELAPELPPLDSELDSN